MLFLLQSLAESPCPLPTRVYTAHLGIHDCAMASLCRCTWACTLGAFTPQCNKNWSCGVNTFFSPLCTLRGYKTVAIVTLLQGKGFLVVYTAGSAETLPKIGGVAGYGVYSECGGSISPFLPTNQPQTVTTAELFAAIQALGSTGLAVLPTSMEE